MKRNYFFAALLALLTTNSLYAQLTCPVDSCGSASDYFVYNGPVITNYHQAIDSWFYYTIDQNLIKGPDTTVCYAFIQAPDSDWTRLQLFVSYSSCPGNDVSYTGYASSVSGFANGNWNVTVSIQSDSTGNCIKGMVTGNADQVPSAPYAFNTLGTFNYANCQKVSSQLNAGTMSSCALTAGQTYKHCFKIIKSVNCPGNIVISPIITCKNNCVPASKACRAINYLSKVTDATCSENGAIQLSVCADRKLNFLWSDSNTSQNRVDLPKGTYQVKITDTQSVNCDTSLSFAINKEACGIEIPNVFTPNGDPNNQFFHIKGLENYPNSGLEIYDRWGAKVYENSNYLNDWDGRDFKSNAPVSEGVYYYIVHQSDETQTNHTGYVQVLR